MAGTKLPYSPYEGQTFQSGQNAIEVPPHLVSYEIWMRCIAKVLAIHPRRTEILGLFMNSHNKLVLPALVGLSPSRAKGKLFAHLYYKGHNLWLPLVLRDYKPTFKLTGKGNDYDPYVVAYLNGIVALNKDKPTVLWPLLEKEYTQDEHQMFMGESNDEIVHFIAWYMVQLINKFGLDKVSARFDPNGLNSKLIEGSYERLRTKIASEAYAESLASQGTMSDIHFNLGMTKERLADLINQWYKLEVSRDDYDSIIDKRRILSCLSSVPSGTFNLPPVPEAIIKVMNLSVSDFMVKPYDDSELATVLEELYLGLLPKVVGTMTGILSFNKWLVSIEADIQPCLKATTAALLPLPEGEHPGIRELIGSFI